MASSKVTYEVNIPLAEQYVEAQVVRGMRALLLEGDRILADILSQPGTGRAYSRGSVVHVASAPGQPPAPDTGQLRNSRDTEVLFTPEGVLGVISVNADHAAPLQLGTDTIAPRPFINRVFDHRDRLFAAFKVGASL